MVLSLVVGRNEGARASNLKIELDVKSVAYKLPTSVLKRQDANVSRETRRRYDGPGNGRGYRRQKFPAFPRSTLLTTVPTRRDWDCIECEIHGEYSSRSIVFLILHNITAMFSIFFLFLIHCKFSLPIYLSSIYKNVTK